MAPFAMPSLPSLPSMPQLPSAASIRTLLDPSPQVFYPAPKSPSRPRSRTRRDSVASIASTCSSNSPIYTQPSRAYPGGQTSAGVHGGIRAMGMGGPSRQGRRGIGNLEVASRSAVDLSGWEKVENPLAVLGRRHSISIKHPHRVQRDLDSVDKQAEASRSQKGRGRGAAVGDSPPLPPQRQHLRTSSPSPRRPSHRRAYSALPGPQPLISEEVCTSLRPSPPSDIPAPLGRLHEFCRNPLASLSAVSLPTLAEGEVADLARLPSPTFRPRRRPSSRIGTSISIHSQVGCTANTAPASPISSSADSIASSSVFGGYRPVSPLSIHSSLTSCSDDDFPLSDEAADDKDARDLDKTPQAPGRAPQRAQRSDSVSSSVPPPQPLGRMRPPPSPRAWSSGAIPTRQRPMSISLPVLARSVSVGKASVSDVAVMATWAFPTSPEKGAQEAGTSGATSTFHGSALRLDPGRPSERLRQKLRDLSMLDTCPAPPAASKPGSSASEESALQTGIMSVSTSQHTRHALLPSFRFPPQPGEKAEGDEHHSRSQARPRAHLPPHVQHRHTHSSPLLLHPHYRHLPSHTSHQSGKKAGIPDRPMSLVRNGIEQTSSGIKAHRSALRPRALQELHAFPQASVVVGVGGGATRAGEKDQSRKDARGGERGRSRTASSPSPAQSPRQSPLKGTLARSRSAAPRQDQGLDIVSGEVTTEGEGGSVKWWRMRRYSISGPPIPCPQESGERSRDVAGMVILGRVREVRGDSPENERFLDFDDI